MVIFGVMANEPKKIVALRQDIFGISRSTIITKVPIATLGIVCIVVTLTKFTFV